MDGRDERLGSEEGALQGAPPRRPSTKRIPADERIAEEREATERELTEERELTDEERLELFMDAQYQSVLPDLPKLPGFHVCYLTTTNARDSIQNRLRLGYKLIRVEECPGWEGIAVQSGDYAGVIGVNEMVAAKLPMRLYNLYMKQAHHLAPLAEEMKLRAQTRGVEDALRAAGSAIMEEGDGTANIVQQAEPPEFHA